MSKSYKRWSKMENINKPSFYYNKKGSSQMRLLPFFISNPLYNQIAGSAGVLGLLDRSVSG